MYITKDTGNIYVDISNTERIQLNADAATRIRTSNTDDSIDLTYEEIQNLFDTKLNSANPIITGSITMNDTAISINSDTKDLLVNNNAMATQTYVNTEIAKIPKILSGTTEPTADIGNVGDIYIQYAEEA